MNTGHDVTRLLEALKWYEYQATGLFLATLSQDGEGLLAIACRLVEDAGQRGMKARALYGDGSEAGAG